MEAPPVFVAGTQFHSFEPGGFELLNDRLDVPVLQDVIGDSA